MADQLLFPSLRDESHVAATARGVFSLPYLRTRLAKLDHCLPPADVDAAWHFALALWEKNHHGLAKGNEAYTRTHFLDPLLAHLGWHFIPEKTQTKHKRPDYWLFIDEARRLQAAEADTPPQLFSLSASVLEAKQFTHPLDAESKKETPGLFPSDQVQGYLSAGHDAHFEFVLADELSFCTREEFATFAALFIPAAFAPRGDGRCPLDDIQAASLSLQAELEGNLRRRIFDVLEELATAFAGHAPNGIAAARLADGSLYDACLVFLYRLLFILYAESRYLLPVRPHGEGSSKFYRERFSLQRLGEPLRQSTAHFTHESLSDLYEDLLKLFRLIDGENEKLSQDARVTRYNGGLFAPDLPAARHLAAWRIPDPALARVLRQLIFAQPPARPSARQQLISTEEAIDYSTLEVRQLGDICEGLLGGQLCRTGRGGALQLTDENGDNYRHGIFYTPDWVVSYLVRATLDPLLARIEASAEVQAALKAKTNEERWNDAFALGVLGLNLVDPAMGSGHFLVRHRVSWRACRPPPHHPAQDGAHRHQRRGPAHQGRNRQSRQNPRPRRPLPGGGGDRLLAPPRGGGLHLRRRYQRHGRGTGQALPLAHLHRHGRAAELP